MKVFNELLIYKKISVFFMAKLFGMALLNNFCGNIFWILNASIPKELFKALQDMEGNMTESAIWICLI